MKVDWMRLLWLASAGLLVMVATATSSDGKANKEVRKEELYILSKLLHPSKRMADDKDALEDTLKKRQQVEMDYGWGGGRFGKRADMLDYGWGGGRFGKRADMLDYGWGGGRFGKRQEMMDYGWGGGRFGKRGEDKRFDLYGSERRFGRDVDHVDPADEPGEV